MKYVEAEVLKKVFWPKDKYELIGNVIHSCTDKNFSFTKTIGITRNEKILEISYYNAPTFAPGNKQYFLQLILKKEGDFVNLNYKHSSPEIENFQDLEIVLNGIHDSIMLMDSQPQFFMTGTLEKDNKTFSI